MFKMVKKNPQISGLEIVAGLTRPLRQRSESLRLRPGVPCMVQPLGLTTQNFELFKLFFSVFFFFF